MLSLSKHLAGSRERGMRQRQPRPCGRRGSRPSRQDPSTGSGWRVTGRHAASPGHAEPVEASGRKQGARHAAAPTTPMRATGLTSLPARSLDRLGMTRYRAARRITGSCWACRSIWPEAGSAACGSANHAHAGDGARVPPGKIPRQARDDQGMGVRDDPEPGAPLARERHPIDFPL